MFMLAQKKEEEEEATRNLKRAGCKKKFSASEEFLRAKLFSAGVRRRSKRRA
jgi:hypothetical protein